MPVESAGRSETRMAIELTEAIERFQRIPFLDLGIDSRADWVANLLLFIPLSYLFAASVSPLYAAIRAWGIVPRPLPLLAKALASVEKPLIPPIIAA